MVEYDVRLIIVYMIYNDLNVTLNSDLNNDMSIEGGRAISQM